MDIEVWVLEQAAVESQDMEQVQMLAFVFVEAFDLDIEDGGRVHIYAAFVLDDFGQVHFVLVFDGHEGIAEPGVFGEGLEASELVNIANPTIADSGGDEVAEAWVGGLEPAARGDAVGFVVELAWVEFVELGEEGAF